MYTLYMFRLTNLHWSEHTAWLEFTVSYNTGNHLPPTDKFSLNAEISKLMPNPWQPSIGNSPAAPILQCRMKCTGAFKSTVLGTSAWTMATSPVLLEATSPSELTLYQHRSQLIQHTNLQVCWISCDLCWYNVGSDYLAVRAGHIQNSCHTWEAVFCRNRPMWCDSAKPYAPKWSTPDTTATTADNTTVIVALVFATMFFILSLGLIEYIYILVARRWGIGLIVWTLIEILWKIELNHSYLC